MGAQNKDIADLLHRLNSRDPGPAWEEFLRLHSALIMKTVTRFEFQEERKSDCFLYVCEKLNDNNFRRLRSYRPRRDSGFATWLTAVAFNLCVDWHRREFGRAVLLPAILALPAFDQLVYRYHFEQGMPASELLEVLRSDFPETDRAALSRSLARIHQLMTPRQRWQAGVRLRRRQRQEHPKSRKPDELPSHIREPFAAMRDRQQQQLLESAMGKLSVNDRLMLRLRYQEGMTLRQIAKHFDLTDTNQAWRHLQRALQRLARHFQGEESVVLRKN